MNKIQIAQLNSFQNTQLVLENGILIWQNNDAFSDNVTEFNGIVAEIFKYKDMQVTDHGGARAYKEQARKNMSNVSIPVRSAVQNFASDSNNIKLYKEANYAPSALYYGNQQKNLSRAVKIETLAKKHISNLAPYKILPADVDA